MVIPTAIQYSKAGHFIHPSPFSHAFLSSFLVLHPPFFLTLNSQVVTFEKDGTFHVLDTLSLHSEHTVYEEIIHSSTTENKVDG
jgi:hypothetical protein